jgi:hypothetical protein
MAWQFLDQKQLILMDWVRHRYGPVFVNNWHEPQWINNDFVKYILDAITSGKPIFFGDEPVAPDALFSQRGLRCNICGLYYQKTKNGVIYVSPHFLGKADDYDVQGLMAEEVRQRLIKDAAILPSPIRLEIGVQWVHMDCEEAISGEKVQLVNP